MPRVLKVYLFHLRPFSKNGNFSEPFKEPIQIASDLEMLSLQPELSENKPIISKSDLKELSEPSIKQVESSASKEILKSFLQLGCLQYLGFV